jgi:hypothetical protein
MPFKKSKKPLAVKETKTFSRSQPEPKLTAPNNEEAF